jgi:D-alanyl-D-alanine carboxypeptidase
MMRLKLRLSDLSIVLVLSCFTGSGLRADHDEGWGSQPACNSEQALQKQLATALRGLDSVGVLGSVVSLDVPGEGPVVATRGHVNIERSASMDSGRLFQIGSQTKMFTAAALLLLQRDGKLWMDDLVSKYVLGVPRPDDLTIRQLAMHTGGIGDGVKFFDPPAGRRPNFEVSFENHILLGKVAGEQFPPGTDWHYNNLGYIVLGQVIEAASGQPLDDYMQQHILRPMGMNNTYLGSREQYPEKQMARGYFNDNGEITDTTQPGLSWASSAGDMVSNIDDMRLWSKILLSQPNPLELELSDFIDGQVPVSDFGNMTAYGLGMMQRNLLGQTLWGHGGFIHGYVTLMLVEPKSGIVIQVMTSLDKESTLIIPAVENVAAMALMLAECGQ